MFFEWSLEEAKQKPSTESPKEAKPPRPSQSDKPETGDAAKASGSGFFITDDGYLVTNNHVVDGANRLMVRTSGAVLPAKLIKADSVNDLAVLKVSGRFRSLAIAGIRSVKLGDSVFTIGFPNVQMQGLEPKLTRGEINSLAGIQDDPRHFQVSVAVQPGNSGSPLLDLNRNVVGIVTLRLNDLETLKLTGSLPQNVNYAIKSSFLSAFLETLPEISGKLREPYPAKDLKFEDIVAEAKEATVLIIAY